MPLNPRIFRQYDIRGVADRDLDDAFVLDLGRALGTFWGRHNARRVTVGRDCRLHSPRLHDALIKGLCETGMHLWDVGVVATPQLYYSVFHFDADGGVQITGSHNPGTDNGFKIMLGRASIHGQDVQELRRIIEKRDFDFVTSPGAHTGSIEKRDIIGPYAKMVQERTLLGARRFKVVVDAGNGMGGDAAKIIAALGFDVTPMFCEPDGTFPHHHPDPTIEKNFAALRAKVAEVGAEVGLALDGDADRIGVVDAKGRIIWGDQLMILFARAILQEEPGATFVSEVKCSKTLYEEIARAGGHAVMWKVGHSLIKEKMKEVRAALAGEMSGHIFFQHRYFGFDDAIYAGVRLVELLSRGTMTLADHVDTLPVVHNTPEIRFEVRDDVKFEVVRRVVQRFRSAKVGENVLEVVDIDGARITWKDAWALVRASNTQPAIVMRFEADSAERLQAVRAIVDGALNQISRDMEKR